MMLRSILKICLVFWKYEPEYDYKRYAYKKHAHTFSVPCSVLGALCSRKHLNCYEGQQPTLNPRTIALFLEL